MSVAGAKRRNASSKPGHFVSITLQAKPAENTRLVISARTRSSPSLASAFGLGAGGSSRLSALGPPLRFSARARMVLNGVMMLLLMLFLRGIHRSLEHMHAPVSSSQSYQRFQSC